MSVNQQKSKVEDETEEKPGTSAAFYGGGAGSLVAGQENASSEEDISEGSKTTSVKARNASRDRPASDTPESKRLKISDDEGDDVIQPGGLGMAMDTDSSEDGEGQNVEHENVVDAGVRTVSDPDSIHFSHDLEPQETGKNQVRRSSTADEDVSTTMQSSSLRYRSMFTPGGRRDSNVVLDQAVASTSAAAMAPPLGRIMEDSSTLNQMYRQSVVYTPEDPPGLRTSVDQSPPVGAQRINENVDVNENQGPEEFLQKMHGKQRLMWARKLFFVSTELVFPGFTAYSDSKSHMADYLGVRIRSSCVMQALLYADSLFFIMWILSFLSTCDIQVSVLKQLHGYLSICLTCLFIIVNIIRLRFGLKGNENDEVQYLALFWMTTVIVQIPLFTFIFLTDLFCPVLMAFTVTMDGAMMIFILVESVVGFIHFRSLLRDELNIIKMAKRSKEARASTTHQRQEDPVEAHSFPPMPSLERNISNHNDTDSNTDSENEPDRGAQDGNMDFRMQIRRLSEAQRDGNENQDDSASDSSEQVTSTSDTIRQRTIRAH